MASDTWHLLTLFSLFIISSYCSHIKVNQDGGYENVVVAISPKISISDGEELLTSLTNLFRSASTALHKATYNLAYFKSVTFLLPPTWGNLTNDGTSTYQTYSAADVRVIQSNDKEEDAFLTLQPNGCGQPGEYVQINRNTFSILQEEIRVRRLVQHWAKYRYGVFEENGEDQSELYPSQYEDGKGSKRTGCAEPYPWEIDPNCDKITDKCFTLSSTIVATTSLLDFYNDQADYFCNATTHNQDAPTRHNALCRQKNVDEIIRNSVDLKHMNDPLTPRQDNEVNFTRLVYTLKPALIVADKLLCSKGAGEGLWTTTFRSIGKGILYILPEELNLAVLPVTDEEEKKPVFLQNKDTVFDKWSSTGCKRAVIPGSLDFGSRILKSIEFLEDGGHLILVAKGTAETTNLVDNLINATTSSKAKNLHVYVLTYPPLPLTEATEKWTDVVQKENVKWYNIRNEKDGSIDFAAWRQVELAFIDIGHQIDAGFSNGLITRYSKLQELETVIEGNFTITASETNVTLSLNTNDPDIESNNIEIWLNGNKIKLEQPDRKSGVYAITTTPQPGWNSFNVTGDKLKGITEGYYFSVVESSKDGEFVEITTTVEQAAEGYTILQVGVRNKGLAVLQANVAARLKEENITFTLTDDGKNGDVLPNDGIYSRFFKPKQKGTYFVEYTVTKNMPMPVTENKPSSNAFSGTDLPFTVIKMESFAFKGDPDYDSVPPNRITDLKNNSIPMRMDDNNWEIAFHWTAPGDDFDIGNVTKYEFKCSEKRSSVSVDAEFGENVMEINGTKPPGEPETYTWKGEIKYDHYYFCAVRAFDAAGNNNMPSNIVTSYVPTPPTTTTMSSTAQPTVSESGATTQTDNSTNTFTVPIEPTNPNITATPPTVSTEAGKAGTDDGGSGDLKVWQIVIIAVGSLLFLILVAVLLWFFCVRKRKTAIATDSSTKNNSRGSIPSNVRIDRLRPQSGIEHMDNSEIYGGFSDDSTGGGRDRRPLSNGNTLASNWGATTLADTPNNTKKTNVELQQQQLQTRDPRRSSVVSEYASYSPQRENQAYEASLENDLYAAGVEEDPRDSRRPNAKDDAILRGYLGKQTARTSIGSNLMVPDEETTTSEPVYSAVNKNTKSAKSQPNSSSNVRVATQV